MNKTAIKNYAIWARVQLIEAVKQRAYEYDVTEKGENRPGLAVIVGKPLTQNEVRQRDRLIAQIRQKGFHQVMEEAAYTWFNRFVAVRFMEVNGYLPSQTRVFTDENGAFKPEILKEAMRVELDGLDRETVLELLDKRNDEALYKYLFIIQCNALSKPLPKMFEKIADWTELLFPANLLRSDSVIGRMVSDIPEADWTDQVQIIGWLYQYYNAELKDETFALLKKNVKVTKERIPAATQLFTPDWIVRYMVENSLGRLWLEGHPDDALKANWKYYLDEAEQEPEVAAKLAELRKTRAQMQPEDIKLIDPCMGSGHILVYAFDVLMQIYTSCGWSERDAAQSIVRNNLYGLDIDERAAQLAYFAVMMKARQYDRRFFSRNLQPMVYSTAGDEDGGTFGSLVLVGDPGKMPEDPQSIVELADYEKRLNAWSYRYVLSQKYDVVVTNPPYMGASGMNGKLSEFVKENYPDSKADLFAVFIERCRQLTVKSGYQAMITQHAWMFLSSFEKLRGKLQTVDTINMAHLGPRAFEEIGGEVVQTTSFVMQKSHIKGYKGTYCRLIEPTTQQGKENMFLAGENRYTAQQDNFSKIPGFPVAYWASEKLINAFTKGISIDTISLYTGSQNITSNNEKYLRYIWEVNNIETGQGKKWVFYIKGGLFRKWYGNIELFVDWSPQARSFYKRNSTSNLLAEKYRFKEGITYTELTSGINSFRFLPPIAVFDKKGPCIVDVNHNLYCLAFFNSCVAVEYFKLLNPTITLQVKDVKNTPIIFCNDSLVDDIEKKAGNCVQICRADWDSFETSWDFQCHPLVQNCHGVENDAGEEQAYIEDAYNEWEFDCEQRFNQLKANEEELNRIFIDIYGLQDELTPEVEDQDVTVRRADLQRDVKSLLSYAVGCMFGRYSLDVDGLAYAGGEWDAGKYKTIIPDADNIIPICDDDYFEDDMLGRFVEFVRRVYGEDTLEQNLTFIADALGGKGASREVIRAYFLNDFYKDHLKIYQKRPIYWLFSSGKKNGFKALIYMHRYRPDLLARMRTDYVHEQQERYRTQLTMLEDSLEKAAASEHVKLNKRVVKLKAQADEILAYEEKIHHLADQMIAVDLDDGVKVNYAKFQDVLEKIK